MSLESRIRRLEEMQALGCNHDLAEAIAIARLLSPEELKARMDEIFSRPVTPNPEIENLSAEELLGKIRSIL